MSKQKRFINHIEYIQAWMTAADQFTAINPVIPPPPDYLIRDFGRPACASCWDTGLCPECYGRYPQYCAADCGDGTCSCAAGRARRAVQMEHASRL